MASRDDDNYWDEFFTDRNHYIGPEEVEKRKELRDDISEVQSELNQALESEWDMKMELNNTFWWDVANINEGRAGELKLEGQRDGSIDIYYEVNGLNGLSDEIPERVDVLEGIFFKRPNYPDIDHGPKKVSMTLEKGLEEYEDGIKRHVRDFGHLVDHADREAAKKEFSDVSTYDGEGYFP